MNQKGFIPILITLGVVIILGITGGAYYYKKLYFSLPGISTRACTQEAKQCPDGSFVSRTGSNCEFSSCLQATPLPKDKTVSTKGQLNTQIVKISGPGMYPTYKNGQTYLVKNSLDFQRGGVVIYRNPKTFDDPTYYVKRIIGLPGESIKIQEGKVYINGVVLNEFYLNSGQQTEGGNFLKENQEIKVPENNYFVLGDNRNASSDSREWGFVTKELILGTIGECYSRCSKENDRIEKLNY